MAIVDFIAIPTLGILSIRGYWEEALRTNTRALDAARQLNDQTAVARFAHNTAMMYQQRGELTEAKRLYEESLTIAKQLGDQEGMASTLHALGILAEKEGNKIQAVQSLQSALEIYEKLHHPNKESAQRALAWVEGKGE